MSGAEDPVVEAERRALDALVDWRRANRRRTNVRPPNLTLATAVAKAEEALKDAAEELEAHYVERWR